MDETVESALEIIVLPEEDAPKVAPPEPRLPEQVYVFDGWGMIPLDS